MAADPRRRDAAADVDRVHRQLTGQLAELMREQGLSKRRLSQLSGVDTSRIREMETGASFPSIPTLVKLFAALGCRLEVYAVPDETR